MVRNFKPCIFLVVFLIAGAPLLHAASVDVDSLEAVKNAMDKAKPGDRIVIADGKYTSKAEIPIMCAGTAEQPIVIEAKTVGGVEINGDAGFTIDKGAAYVVIKGFVFTHKAGSMNIDAKAHDC